MTWWLVYKLMGYNLVFNLRKSFQTSCIIKVFVSIKLSKGCCWSWRSIRKEEKWLDDRLVSPARGSSLFRAETEKNGTKYVDRAEDHILLAARLVSLAASKASRAERTVPCPPPSARRPGIHGAWVPSCRRFNSSTRPVDGGKSPATIWARFIFHCSARIGSCQVKTNDTGWPEVGGKVSFKIKVLLCFWTCRKSWVWQENQ